MRHRQGQPLYTAGIRSHAAFAAMVERTRACYALLRADEPNIGQYDDHRQWTALTAVADVHDPDLAAMLHSRWDHLDARDLLRTLAGHPPDQSLTVLWQFVRDGRRLVCVLKEDSRWIDLIVDREEWQYRRERFDARGPALARAGVWRAQLQRTTWREVVAA